MIMAFMSDASNLLSFFGSVDVENSVGYAVELWIFKPQKSGKQVICFIMRALLSFSLFFNSLPLW